jgi:hypothetical protein
MSLRTSGARSAAAVAVSALLGSGVAAQTGGGYDLRWNSMDGGAATCTAGSYVLRGTVAQPEAGNSSGGNYALRGGFWQGATSTSTDVPPDATDGTGALVFRLHPNAPNPFTAATALAFNLEREAEAQLQVYDLAGRLVRTVLARRLGAGRHQVMWDGRDDEGRRAAHGIYFVRLRAGAMEARRKVVLVP